jgi:hypothetical protein
MKNRKVMLAAVVLCGLVMLTGSGCATIITGSKGSVEIASNPSGASISIDDSKGKTIYEGQTPTVVTLKKGAGYFKAQNYVVTFEKPGYKTQTAKITQGLSGWYWGNILFGGLIGMLIVDPITGAMYTLDDLSINLKSSGSSMYLPDSMYLPEDGRLQIVNLDQVPESLRSSMVRIN